MKHPDVHYPMQGHGTGLLLSADITQPQDTVPLDTTMVAGTSNTHEVKEVRYEGHSQVRWHSLWSQPPGG